MKKIVEGRKTQTRRTSRNELRIGKVYPARCRYFERAKVKVLIIRKFKQRLGDISLEDVRKEGFETLEEFRVGWTRIHGSWKPDIIVIVYEFKLVMPEREPLEFSCARGMVEASLQRNMSICETSPISRREVQYSLERKVGEDRMVEEADCDHEFVIASKHTRDLGSRANFTIVEICQKCCYIRSEMMPT